MSKPKILGKWWKVGDISDRIFMYDGHNGLEVKCHHCGHLMEEHGMRENYLFPVCPGNYIFEGKERPLVAVQPFVFREIMQLVEEVN